jgi:hypothetical protein
VDGGRHDFEGNSRPRKVTVLEMIQCSDVNADPS